MKPISALLVQRREYGEPNLLDEFESIATSAGYDIVGEFDIVGATHGRYGISIGKADEIEKWIQIHEPAFVLFSPHLKSTQMFRLMEKWDVEVRDRPQVILEIFSRHAQTRQAKLQIEQARLEYELPFMKHQARMRLQREHTGDRPTAQQIGAGEDILNLRLNQIQNRLAKIREKLDKISDVQKLKKKRRKDLGFAEVTLAGYTNAGKSTLHVKLTDSNAEITDELFTTLSTKASRISIPGRDVVLTDSVGFISNLPSKLFQAFDTTLMEITDADVIVLVVDVSDSFDEMERKTQTCMDTFDRIGVNSIPIVAALNKTDLVTDKILEHRKAVLESTFEQVIPISAKNGENLDVLLKAVQNALPELHKYSLSVPNNDQSMSFISWLHDVGEVKNQSFEGDTIRLQASITPKNAQQMMNNLPGGEAERLN
jgi:GTPase